MGMRLKVNIAAKLTTEFRFQLTRHKLGLIWKYFGGAYILAIHT
jgi:hypothetical protein